jgi:hypothetical protein
LLGRIWLEQALEAAWLERTQHMHNDINRTATGQARQGGLRHWVGLCLTLCVGVCAANPPTKLGQAVSSPMSDLNVGNTPIPEPLKEALAAPYKWSAEASCEQLREALQALDAALGPDLDRVAPVAADGLKPERGVELAGEAAVDMLQRTTGSLLPYRGWIRKISGAERHTKEVEAAVQAGTARRGFLRGVAMQKSCPSAG